MHGQSQTSRRQWHGSLFLIPLGSGPNSEWVDVIRNHFLPLLGTSNFVYITLLHSFYLNQISLLHQCINSSNLQWTCPNHLSEHSINLVSIGVTSTYLWEHPFLIWFLFEFPHSHRNVLISNMIILWTCFLFAAQRSLPHHFIYLDQCHGQLYITGNTFFIWFECLELLIMTVA